MALDPCVEKVLRAMTAAGLEALCTALRSYSAIAQAELLKTQIAALKLDVLAAQVGVVQAAVNAYLDPIEAQLKFFPAGFADLVLECAQLGDLITSPQDVLGFLRNSANAILFRAREITTLSDDYTAKVNQLNDIIQITEEICDLIYDVLIPEKTMQVT